MSKQTCPTCQILRKAGCSEASLETVHKYCHEAPQPSEAGKPEIDGHWSDEGAWVDGPRSKVPIMDSDGNMIALEPLGEPQSDSQDCNCLLSGEYTVHDSDCPNAAPNPSLPDELEAVVQKVLSDFNKMPPYELDYVNRQLMDTLLAAITRLYAGREAAARADQLDKDLAMFEAIQNATPEELKASIAETKARLASLREGEKPQGRAA